MNTPGPQETTVDIFLSIFNSIPSPTFVVDDDVHVLYWNSAAEEILGQGELYLKRSGEILDCIHATEVPEGCGRSPSCKDCMVRRTVNQSFLGKKITRNVSVMTLKTDQGKTDVTMLVTAAPIHYQGRNLSLLIFEDVSELMTLRGLIPICVNCKKIREDTNYWQSVEAYMSKHLDLQFTHGICPDCRKTLYPGI